MNELRLRLRPDAAVWRQVLTWEPDPLVIAASAREVRGWLDGGVLETQALLSSEVDGVPYALVAAPVGDAVWVPAAALAPAGEGPAVLLVQAVAALGSRMQRQWRASTVEGDGEWVQVGSEGETVLFRRWDPVAGEVAGPLFCASAFEVLEKLPGPRAAAPQVDGPEGGVRTLSLLSGEAPSSEDVIARFLRREGAGGDALLVCSVLESLPLLRGAADAPFGEAGEAGEGSEVESELRSEPATAGQRNVPAARADPARRTETDDRARARPAREIPAPREVTVVREIPPPREVTVVREVPVPHVVMVEREISAPRQVTVVREIPVPHTAGVAREAAIPREAATPREMSAARESAQPRDVALPREAATSPAIEAPRASAPADKGAVPREAAAARPPVASQVSPPSSQPVLRGEAPAPGAMAPPRDPAPSRDLPAAQQIHQPPVREHLQRRDVPAERDSPPVQAETAARQDAPRVEAKDVPYAEPVKRPDAVAHIETPHRTGIAQRSQAPEVAPPQQQTASARAAATEHAGTPRGADRDPPSTGPATIAVAPPSPGKLEPRAQEVAASPSKPPAAIAVQRVALPSVTPAPAVLARPAPGAADPGQPVSVDSRAPGATLPASGAPRAPVHAAERSARVADKPALAPPALAPPALAPPAAVARAASPGAPLPAVVPPRAPALSVRAHGTPALPGASPPASELVAPVAVADHSTMGLGSPPPQSPQSPPAPADAWPRRTPRGSALLPLAMPLPPAQAPTLLLATTRRAADVLPRPVSPLAAPLPPLAPPALATAPVPPSRAVVRAIEIGDIVVELGTPEPARPLPPRTGSLIAAIPSLRMIGGRL